MEADKLKRFLDKNAKLLVDAGGGKVFTYSGRVTSVTDNDISIVSLKFGETVLMNKMVLQITESNGGAQ